MIKHTGFSILLSVKLESDTTTLCQQFGSQSELFHIFKMRILKKLYLMLWLTVCGFSVNFKLEEYMPATKINTRKKK